MSTLDIFIVNVAIPSTQRDLHASDSAVQWIVAGFGLAVAAGVITAGRLGDMFGRRRMFNLGLGLFTAASAACGFAPSVSTLIGARVLQGLAAALLTPQVLAILGTAFAGRALTKAFTAYGLAMGLAAIFGQLIGGVLIQADLFGAGWRWCFLINVPVGIAALALSPRVVPESSLPHRSRLDWTGAALLTGALVAIVLPLIQGASRDGRCGPTELRVRRGADRRLRLVRKENRPRRPRAADQPLAVRRSRVQHGHGRAAHRLHRSAVVLPGASRSTCRTGSG